MTQTAVVSLSAEDRGSHPAGLRAEVAYKPGNVVVNLTQMAVTTGDGSWQLTAPAQLTQRGRAIEIRRFAAANHNQSLTLDGTISQAGPQDLTLHVQNLRLDDFSGFVPGQVKPVGLASANLAVRGSAAAPVITMAANVSDLRVSSIPQAEFSARLSYSGGKAQAEATLSQNATHSLNATAMLPLQLSWAQGFQSRVTGDLDLRAFSSGLDLAVINAFRNPQVSGIGGILSLDVRAHGPLQHPIPGGFIRLSGGHAKAGKLNVEVTEGSADIQLGAREVRLVTLSARAGEGTLTGGGALTLEPNGTPGQLSLHVALDRWPAIATHQYNAAITERIDAGGSLTALNIRGRVEVLHGVFRPDLSVAGGAPRPDETVTVVHRWSETSPRRPSPPVKNQATTGPTFQNLAIDVDIVIDRNTWIKTADFAVEMEGDVHVQKRRGGELILSGAINTVRGTLVVAGREFDLARGHIMFTGDLLSATVGGSANKPTLTLSSIPDLPQADILSVMMFGKPSNQLSGGQQKDLQSQALSMAGSYAASQVGQAVAQALGLGELGVTTSSSGVGFGRYLTQNVYVSASQSASNMQDRKAEMQYYLTPSINLGTSASTNYGNEIKLQWHKEY